MPGQVAILTNFTRPTPGRPALFKFGELRTLFHEFGHAMHALLVETQYSFMDLGEMAVTYGLPIKTDFTELPSQMLERWLDDAQIVQGLSHHYETGQKLPSEQVQMLVSQAKGGMLGFSVFRQVALSKLALGLFSNDKPASPVLAFALIDALDQARQKELFFQATSDESHFPASWLHLTSYGARYYSYIWTSVFAFDLFSVFQASGLLKNQELGKRYCKEVLAQGGSVHPSALLESFLGRSLSSKPFLDQLKVAQ